MNEPTPSVINYNDDDERVDDQMRAWAHRRLDELLTNREKLREANPSILHQFQLFGTGDDLASSRDIEQYFRDVLAFSTQIIGRDIREAVAPTYTAEGVEQRAALSKQIELVQSVWPQRSKSVGSFSRQTLWDSEITQALEMLDEGQVPSIFQRATGANKKNYSWRDKRFKALAAMWAIHYETALGKGSYAANDEVAQAFGFPGDNIRRSVTIARWRKDFQSGRLGVDAFNVNIGTCIAHEPICPDHDPKHLAQSLSGIAFGTLMNGSVSLADAGQRYQAHKAAVDKQQPVTKRRGARSKTEGA